MVPVTFKIEEAELAELDRFIAGGYAGTRTDALREALRSWLKSQRDRKIAEEYRRASIEHPQPDWSIGDGQSAFEAWSIAQDDDPESLFP